MPAAGAARLRIDQASDPVLQGKPAVLNASKAARSLANTNVNLAILSVCSNPVLIKDLFPIKLKETLSDFHLFSFDLNAEIAISK